MSARAPVPGKRYFTAAQANAMLPLVRRIARDIADLANDLRDRHARLSRLKPRSEREVDAAHLEELMLAEREFERARAQMEEYERELKQLGVELKDYFTGLIDFPCWMDDREVYLCWRLGEPEVAHWHETDAGFAGRQPLLQESSTT